LLRLGVRRRQGVVFGHDVRQQGFAAHIERLPALPVFWRGKPLALFESFPKAPIRLHRNVSGPRTHRFRQIRLLFLHRGIAVRLLPIARVGVALQFRQSAVLRVLLCRRAPLVIARLRSEKHEHVDHHQQGSQPWEIAPRQRAMQGQNQHVKDRSRKTRPQREPRATRDQEVGGVQRQFDSSTAKLRRNNPLDPTSNSALNTASPAPQTQYGNQSAASICATSEGIGPAEVCATAVNR